MKLRHSPQHKARTVSHVRIEYSSSLDQVVSALEKMNVIGPLLLISVVGVYGAKDGM